MKKVFLFFPVCFLFFLGRAQQGQIAALQAKLASVKTDTGKVNLLIEISKAYEPLNLDSAISFARRGYDLSGQINFPEGEATGMMSLGSLFMKKDNYLLGLQSEIKALPIFENLNDDRGLQETYYSMGNIYERIGDNNEALNNFRQALEKANDLNDPIMLMNCYSSIGYNYYELNEPDSALKYAQLSNDIARAKGASTGRLPWTIALLGAAQDKMGNPEIAMAYYYDALSKAGSSGADQQDLYPYLYQAMAVLYKHTTLMDSAIVYGQKSLEISQKNNFSKGIADASTFLADIYSEKDNNKAVEYYRMAFGLRDSIFSEDKLRQLQNISYNEDMRHRELQKQKILVQQNRQRNIQYAGITMGLISFLIIFLLLSHSVIVNAKIISAVGLVGLLVAFEFINLYLHPYLADLTNDSPFLMLLALVLIASLLVPAHHYLQHWINVKLVQKNNRIRLAAAHKTIADLEG